MLHFTYLKEFLIRLWNEDEICGGAELTFLMMFCLKSWSMTIIPFLAEFSAGEEKWMLRAILC